MHVCINTDMVSYGANLSLVVVIAVVEVDESMPADDQIGYEDGMDQRR